MVSLHATTGILTIIVSAMIEKIPGQMCIFIIFKITIVKNS